MEEKEEEIKPKNLNKNNIKSKDSAFTKKVKKQRQDENNKSNNDNERKIINPPRGRGRGRGIIQFPKRSNSFSKKQIKQIKKIVDNNNSKKASNSSDTKKKENNFKIDREKLNRQQSNHSHNSDNDDSSSGSSSNNDGSSSSDSDSDSDSSNYNNNGGKNKFNPKKYAQELHAKSIIKQMDKELRISMKNRPFATPSIYNLISFSTKKNHGIYRIPNALIGGQNVENRNKITEIYIKLSSRYNFEMIYLHPTSKFLIYHIKKEVRSIAYSDEICTSRLYNKYVVNICTELYNYLKDKNVKNIRECNDSNPHILYASVRKYVENGSMVYIQLSYSGLIRLAMGDNISRTEDVGGIYYNCAMDEYDEIRVAKYKSETCLSDLQFRDQVFNPSIAIDKDYILTGTDSIYYNPLLLRYLSFTKDHYDHMKAAVFNYNIYTLYPGTYFDGIVRVRVFYAKVKMYLNGSVEILYEYKVKADKDFIDYFVDNCFDFGITSNEYLDDETEYVSELLPCVEVEVPGNVYPYKHPFPIIGGYIISIEAMNKNREYHRPFVPKNKKEREPGIMTVIRDCVPITYYNYYVSTISTITEEYDLSYLKFGDVTLVKYPHVRCLNPKNDVIATNIVIQQTDGSMQTDATNVTADIYNPRIVKLTEPERNIKDILYQFIFNNNSRASQYFSMNNVNIPQIEGLCILSGRICKIRDRNDIAKRNNILIYEQDVEFTIKREYLTICCGCYRRLTIDDQQIKSAQNMILQTALNDHWVPKIDPLLANEYAILAANINTYLNAEIKLNYKRILNLENETNKSISRYEFKNKLDDLSENINIVRDYIVSDDAKKLTKVLDKYINDYVQSKQPILTTIGLPFLLIFYNICKFNIKALDKCIDYSEFIPVLGLLIIILLYPFKLFNTWCVRKLRKLDYIEKGKINFVSYYHNQIIENIDGEKIKEKLERKFKDIIWNNKKKSKQLVSNRHSFIIIVIIGLCFIKYTYCYFVPTTVNDPIFADYVSQVSDSYILFKGVLYEHFDNFKESFKEFYYDFEFKIGQQEFKQAISLIFLFLLKHIILITIIGIFLYCLITILECFYRVVEYESPIDYFNKKTNELKNVFNILLVKFKIKKPEMEVRYNKFKKFFKDFMFGFCITSIIIYCNVIIAYLKYVYNVVNEYNHGLKYVYEYEDILHLLIDKYLFLIRTLSYYVFIMRLGGYKLKIPYLINLTYPIFKAYKYMMYEQTVDTNMLPGRVDWFTTTIIISIAKEYSSIFLILVLPLVGCYNIFINGACTFNDVPKMFDFLKDILIYHKLTKPPKDVKTRIESYYTKKSLNKYIIKKIPHDNDLLCEFDPSKDPEPLTNIGPQVMGNIQYFNVPFKQHKCKVNQCEAVFRQCSCRCSYKEKIAKEFVGYSRKWIKRMVRQYYKTHKDRITLREFFTKLGSKSSEYKRAYIDYVNGHRIAKEFRMHNKADEKLPIDPETEKNKARNISAQRSIGKLLLGLVCHYGMKVIHEQPWCGAGTNYDEKAIKFSNWNEMLPIDSGILCCDGSSFDSTQHKYFIAKIDSWFLKMILDANKDEICQYFNYSDVLCVINQCNFDIYTKYFYFTVEGTQLSGRMNTCLCNTLRSACYIKFIIKKAKLKDFENIFYEVLGDDQIIFIAMKYKDLYVKMAYKYVYMDKDAPIEHGLGQICKIFDWYPYKTGAEYLSCFILYCSTTNEFLFVRKPNRFFTLTPYTIKNKFHNVNKFNYCQARLAKEIGYALKISCKDIDIYRLYAEKLFFLGLQQMSHYKNVFHAKSRKSMQHILEKVKEHLKYKIYNTRKLKGNFNEIFEDMLLAKYGVTHEDLEECVRAFKNFKTLNDHCQINLIDMFSRCNNSVKYNKALKNIYSRSFITDIEIKKNKMIFNYIKNNGLNLPNNIQ